MSVRVAVLVAALGLCTPTLRAEVQLHPLFTDNMVLQQGQAAPVFGLAKPGDKITLSIKEPNGEVIHSKESIVAKDDGYFIGKLPSNLKAGTGYELTVSDGTKPVTLKNVAVGEVWICSGQSNMEWPVNISGEPEKVKANAKDSKLRLFTVQKRTAIAPITDQKDLKHFSKWAECTSDNVGGFSAVAYHFGAHLRKNLPNDMPIGLIHTSWGGTPAEAWTSTEALDAVPMLKYYVQGQKNTIASFEKAVKEYDVEKAKANYEAALKKWEAAVAKAKEEKKPLPQKPQMPQKPSSVGPGTPASLYNAMIHPLLPYAIQGAIWYQGESNAGRAYEYRTLFQTMIKDWRSKWNRDLPFMLVQLAPFNSGNPDAPTWGELREAQFLATVQLPKVGMAVITDAGHPTDIHPKDKFTVGTRLGLQARTIVYGDKIESSGPIYQSLKIDGNKAIVSFTHADGLICKGNELTEFVICGEDKVFHKAKAEIKGNTVIVTSDKVEKPVAVRFAWKNFPQPNLYNGAGLPACPFRTDDFQMTTAPQPKKK
jgi:sialate O-acetylesterase